MFVKNPELEPQNFDGFVKKLGPLMRLVYFLVIGSHQIPMPSLIGIEIELWLSRLLYGALLSILSLG